MDNWSGAELSISPHNHATPAFRAFLREAEVPDGREFGEEGLRQRDHVVHARGAQRDVQGCGLGRGILR